MEKIRTSRKILLPTMVIDKDPPSPSWQSKTEFILKNKEEDKPTEEILHQLEPVQPQPTAHSNPTPDKKWSQPDTAEPSIPPPQAEEPDTLLPPTKPQWEVKCILAPIASCGVVKKAPNITK